MDSNIRELSPREKLVRELASRFVQASPDFRPSEESAEIAVVAMLLGFDLEEFGQACEASRPGFVSEWNRFALATLGHDGACFPTPTDPLH